MFIMKEKSAGIIRGSVWCRTVGFMIAMLIYLTGADALFAEKVAGDFGATAGSPGQVYPDTQLTDTIPHGTWETVRIVNEKTVGGKTETTRYNTMADVKDYIFPQSMEIKDSLTVELSFIDTEEKRTATYIIESDRFSLIDGPLRLVYLCDYKDGDLVLTMEYPLLNPKRDGNSALRTEEIAEKWIFILKIQDRKSVV